MRFVGKPITSYVMGEGPKPSPLMIIGEGPGDDELAKDRPFVGPMGWELDTLLRSVARVKRSDCYLTYWSKRKLEGDKQLSDVEWPVMKEMLEDEIEEVKPKVILALGAKAVGFFMHKPSMEAVNGVPIKWEGPNGDVIVVPSISPAVVFRDGSKHQWVMEAFTVWGKVVRGEWRRDKQWGNDKFRTVSVTDCISEMSNLIAVDTELRKDGSTYMCQISTRPDNAALFYAEEEPELWGLINKAMNKPGVITVMQNAMFDWPILKRHGVCPAVVHDTMQIAFLLQTLPLGLKALSYRLLGWQMKPYRQVVYGDAKDLDEEDKEKTLDLSDIDRREREWYAIRDPVATLRCYLAMIPMMYEGMREVFERDMNTMPMFMAMMERGFMLDKVHLATMKSSVWYGNFELQEEINKRFKEAREVAPTKGKFEKGIFNPGSDKQLAELLYGKLKLHKKARIEPKKSRWGGSVDESHLLRLNDYHEVVPMVRKYRTTKTLIEDYLEALPKYASKDGAIHTKFSLIRNKHSGRPASSNPNLLNIPTRTEEGRLIRDAFVAREGFTILSFDYCLHPSTRVLTYDLRWVPVGQLKVGDDIWGVDEKRPADSPFRKMRKTKIEAVKEVVRPSYQIVMDDGTKIIASGEHPWLARHAGERKNGAYSWVRTDKLRASYRLWKALDTWTVDDSRELGYLGGAFDGEGSISVGRGIVMTFTQKPGIMLGHVENLLKKHGYEFHDPWTGKKGGFENSGSVASIWISNRRDIARFLGTCRPVRLLDKAQALFEGRRPPMKDCKVVSIEAIGPQVLTAVQTGTRTFIAEGFITHNSQIEMRLMAHLADDPTMIGFYLDGLDVHTQTAMRGFGIERIEDVDEMQHRYPAKRTGFGIINDISDKGLARELTDGGAKGWDPAKCHEFKQTWFGIYPKIKDYMESRKQEARLRHKVTDMYGRMEYIGQVRAYSEDVRMKGERIAINQSIQSGAAGIIKEAMVRMTSNVVVWMEKDVAYPLLQIYDDLTFEVRKDKVEECAEIIKWHMEHAAELKVPLVVEGKVGDKWGSMKKIGKKGK